MTHRHLPSPACSPAQSGAGSLPRDPLRELRQRFVAGLGARGSELAAAASPAQRAEVLHQLAGAAGVFGFRALWDASRAGERALLAGRAAAGRVAVRAVLALIAQAIEAPVGGRDTQS